MANTPPTHNCYVVTEAAEGQKARWIEVGAAWTNKDGSLGLRLDALPMDGRLVIQARKPKVQSDT